MSSSGWTPTKIVLQGFLDLLACGKCKKTPKRPMRYVTCGHFFCDNCIYGETTCFQCKIPIGPNELQPYDTIAKLIEYCHIVNDVISETKPEDLKPLEKAVRQFSAERSGVVPETDSESEDDEVIESTPPDRRNLEKKNVELETRDSTESRESSQYREKKDLETIGYVDSLQLSQHRVKKKLSLESVDYVDTAQLSQNQEKQIFHPESVKFHDSTELSQVQDKKDLQPETVGYVDPTQFTPLGRKKVSQPETAGYVDPTQFNSSNVQKIAESETIGYIDPTQFSPFHGKKISEPETVGYVEPTQLSQHREKKKFHSKTVGYVDSTKINKSHDEQELQPETIGYLDRTLSPPNRKKSCFFLKLQNKEKNKNLMPESFANFVDSTRKICELDKKNLKTDGADFIEPKLLKKREKLNLSTEIVESAESERKNRIYDRTVSLTKPAEFMEPEIFEKSDVNDLQPETMEKFCRLDGKASITESTEFIDSTPFEKLDSTNLQPETVGYRDSTKIGEFFEKNIMEFVASSPIAKPKEKINRKTKNSSNDWYEKMDLSEQTSDCEKITSIRRSNENLLLAPESVEMEHGNFANIVIAETLENHAEDTTNYCDTPMEIEEQSLPTKFTRAQVYVEKNSHNDGETSTMSNSHDNTMKSVENREETPFEKLKRIKSLALNRRNKIHHKFHDRDDSMEFMELRKKSPEKKLKIVDNISNDRCDDKIRSINRDSKRQASGEMFGTESEEFVEKIASKELELGKKMLNEEKNYSNLDHDTRGMKNLQTKDRHERNEITKDFEGGKKCLTIERENRNKMIDESTQLPETREKQQALQQLRSVENLSVESTIETPVKKCKEKFVKLKSRRGNDKTRATTSKIVPKNLNKRNAKGETPLHTACVKGQSDYVKALLDAGSNPNTKDNANWTPLQEAVTFGHREVCEMLLQAGASANTPAMDNRTALHDAAANDKLEEAALLLRYSANTNVYDKFGKRPIDYAVSDEMRDLLNENDKNDKIVNEITLLDSTLDQSIIVPNAKVVVLPSNLSNKNRKLLSQLALKLKVEVATSFRPSVTHLVVETNERNITKLTYDVMLAILQGKWILNSQWITICTDLNDISEIDLELFEVHGAPNPETPIRARTNEEKQNPRLFNNCFFYFAIGPRCTWSYEKFEFTKESLTILVHGGQGEILNREPDPEDVKDYKLTPFHVAHKPIHPLHRCSHYIIYMPGKDEPRVKYNMPHIKSLPVGWFLECIEKFSLVDPLLMGIS